VREPYWCDTQHLSGVQLVVPTGKGYREMTCTLFADCVIFFLENQGHIEDEKAYHSIDAHRLKDLQEPRLRKEM
jgi:hypothetical protein